MNRENGLHENVKYENLQNCEFWVGGSQSEKFCGEEARNYDLAKYYGGN